jgi:hypothetical protein
MPNTLGFGVADDVMKTTDDKIWKEKEWWTRYPYHFNKVVKDILTLRVSLEPRSNWRK